ncbi:unnamed protein product [Vicia faba]|uniref:ACT domain-containing protein ACR n=1 Tax=Vicia faba TaxID=3906 RepID=A0AAV1AS43_VICFA|nr:unnamed protein product [Vicia faba]
MGIPWDDIVVIQHAKKSNEPTTVTVNCPDKAGLGCDLCRIILEFGLRITRADISTDGRWCYIIFWVIPHSESLKVDWESLKTRLLSPCPSCLDFRSERIIIRYQRNLVQPPAYDSAS